MAAEICGYIYEIRNKVNGKCYVGLTTATVERRWALHVVLAERAQNPTGIRAAIRKYSPEEFEVTTIDSAETIKELIDKEVFYIQSRGTRAPKGYNLTKGGELPEGTPITVNGIEFKSIKAAAIEFDIPYKLVTSRLVRRNWTIRQAFGLEAPPILHSFEIELEGKSYKSHAKAAHALGLDPKLVHSRLKAGWSDKEAFGLDSPPTALEILGKTYNSFAEAARDHGIEPGIVRGRLGKDWTIEQAFGIEPPPSSFEIGGKRFNTISEACEAFDLPVDRVRSRLNKLGWSKEQAFELAEPPNDLSITVEGVIYPTLNAATEAYGIEPGTVAYRLRSGWTERQAYGLDPMPPHVAHGNAVRIHGVEFPSVTAAARKYGINAGTVKSRLKLGWTIEQAVGIAPKPARSAHNAISVELEDIVYPSRASAAGAYGIELKVVEGRLVSGWTLAEAFGITSRKGYKGPKKVSVAGQDFPSINAAARYFNISCGNVYARLRSGWDLEEAMGLKKRPNKNPVKIGGKTYSSMAEAAHAHGLSPDLVGKRLRELEWSIEEALEIKIRKQPIVVKGKEYPSINAAARAYGIKPDVASGRFHTHGWSIEEALEIAPRKKWQRKGTEVTVNGVTYSSIKKAADAYGIAPYVVSSRVRNYGWTFEEALGITPRVKWQRRKKTGAV